MIVIVIVRSRVRVGTERDEAEAEDRNQQDPDDADGEEGRAIGGAVFAQWLSTFGASRGDPEISIEQSSRPAARTAPHETMPDSLTDVAMDSVFVSHAISDP